MKHSMMKGNSPLEAQLWHIQWPPEMKMRPPGGVNDGESEVKSRHNYCLQFQTRRDMAIWRPLSDNAEARERESAWMWAQ